MKTHVISGVCIKYRNTVPCNGRIYPKEIFEREIENYKRKLNYKLRTKKLERILKNEI